MVSSTATDNFVLNRIREDAVASYTRIAKLGGQPPHGLVAEQALAGLLDHLGTRAVELAGRHPSDPGLIALAGEITSLRLAIHGKGAR